jgi:hypothetical protein
MALVARLLAICKQFKSDHGHKPTLIRLHPADETALMAESKLGSYNGHATIFGMDIISDTEVEPGKPLVTSRGVGKWVSLQE